MGKTADTVNGFMGALGRGDFAGARKLLADDLVFQGPFDTFSTAEPYLEALKKLYPIVKGVKVQKLFVDGDDACLLYDMETSTPVGSALICEWYRVQDGKIKTMRAVFDARPFAPMFSK
jgi:limonene-1,2-epoxide hydrolase